MDNLLEYRVNCMSNVKNSQTIDELANEFLELYINSLFKIALQAYSYAKNLTLILESKGPTISNYYTLYFTGNFITATIHLPEKYNIQILKKSAELFKSQQSNAMSNVQFTRPELDTYNTIKIEYKLFF